jgi:Histidine kinase
MAPNDEHARERRRRHAAVAAAALVAGAFQAAHGLAYEDRINPWAVAFATLSMLAEIEVLASAFDVRRASTGAFVGAGAVALGAGVAAAFGGWALQRALGVPLVGAARAFHPGVLVQVGAFDGVLGLGLWAIAVAVPFAVRDATARRLEADRLRGAAELARLRAHLEPHFLLNTLNTIAGLAADDPRAARNLLGALGDLLRDSLEETGETQTLGEQVEWLKRYAEILETRHRGFLAFRWDIAEATLRARVPRLLLQPLLENAVKHGALRRREGGEVTVRTAIDPAGAGRVTCVVEDNGPGPGGRKAREGALGLPLVTRRLELEYAGAAAFRLEAAEGRTRSIVEIPLEVAP